MYDANFLWRYRPASTACVEFIYVVDVRFLCCTDGEKKNGIPLLDIERKNSLSLEVAFVKVNISRSRKGLVPVDLLSVGSTNLSPSPAQSVYGSRASEQTANVVRFSGLYSSRINCHVFIFNGQQ